MKVSNVVLMILTNLQIKLYNAIACYHNLGYLRYKESNTSWWNNSVTFWQEWVNLVNNNYERFLTLLLPLPLLTLTLDLLK